MYVLTDGAGVLIDSIIIYRVIYYATCRAAGDTATTSLSSGTRLRRDCCCIARAVSRHDAEGETRIAGVISPPFRKNRTMKNKNETKHWLEVTTGRTRRALGRTHWNAGTRDPTAGGGPVILSRGEQKYSAENVGGDSDRCVRRRLTRAIRTWCRGLCQRTNEVNLNPPPRAAAAAADLSPRFLLLLLFLVVFFFSSTNTPRSRTAYIPRAVYYYYILLLSLPPPLPPPPLPWSRARARVTITRRTGVATPLLPQQCAWKRRPVVETEGTWRHTRRLKNTT